MKKLLQITFLVLAVTLSGVEGSAQTNVYHPFPDSNAHWSETSWWVYWSSPPCTVTDVYTLFLSGDTIIGTNIYHKVLKSGYISASCPPPGYYYFNQLAGAIRQDTAQKKIFLATGGGDTLLYDFNLNVGDTLPQSYNYGTGNSVIGIDSVMVGINYHKRFLLKSLSAPSPQDSSYAIIEGIGSTFGLYNPIAPPFESGSQLNCFSHNGQNYPTNSSCTFAMGINNTTNQKFEFEISPNPTSGKFTLKGLTLDVRRLEIYNVFGELVYSTSNLKLLTANEIDLSQAPSGIYFLKATDANGNFGVKKIIIQ